MSDPLRSAMRTADHWAQLGWAEAWDRVGNALAAEYPASARAAWQHAWDGYEAYREAYAQHLPAARWDYDFRGECDAARARATARMPAVDRGPPLPAWLVAALAGQLADAVDAIPSAVGVDLEREAARALTIALAAAGRRDDAERLAAAARL
jgi:hypothetical protein